MSAVEREVLAQSIKQRVEEEVEDRSSLLEKQLLLKQIWLRQLEELEVVLRLGETRLVGRGEVEG